MQAALNVSRALGKGAPILPAGRGLGSKVPGLSGSAARGEQKNEAKVALLGRGKEMHMILHMVPAHDAPWGLLAAQPKPTQPQARCTALLSPPWCSPKPHRQL